ncbi:TPA: tyrosine-type recombinase/integrase [Acinetobacter baumannii]|jgi:integrase|uniref:tyrosine-type recombinase/integrase n=1 Tax=Acinetobacter sp. TaxID=472 RepID=UPI00131960E4|nr:tyrosine-type recombinase/integrase [Acinetobacter sp.]MDR2250540.1 tyrosine-type recombinase/integrase [Acinetobacter sp.]QHB89532.1 tyrosine-type recombinase/integrase [Acinetobacter baumannii]HCA5349037.1 tyrosine-type recombinase/integrase [Acinetobacter baumannii]HEM6662779.1 tyrosine-type recombinase/integrase [Acinetobacter baumannii]
MKRTDPIKKPMKDTVLSSLEPEADTEYRINDGDNLYFVVSPKGNKRWDFRYKKPLTQKWNWMGLGAYPEVSGKLARQKAAAARELLADGIDPKEHRDQEKQALLNSDQFSFKSLAVEYCKNKKWTDGTRTRNEGALNNHVYPLMGSRDYRRITKKEWLDLIRDIQKKLHPRTGKPIVEMGNRIRGLCRDIYDLAEVTGRIEFNPLSGLEKFIEKHKQQNMDSVKIDELPKLLVDIRAYPSRVTSIGLQLLSMVACRPTELREATWDEFNLEKALWTIPSKRMKKRIEHTIPLPTQALILLNELKSYSGNSAYLFKSRSDSNRPVSNNTFNKALKSMGYQGKQTPHGFRHIFSTELREQGFDRDHVEAALAHKVGGVEGVYNKAIYVEPRKAMLQRWADYLDGLVDAEMKREVA